MQGAFALGGNFAVQHLEKTRAASAPARRNHPATSGSAFLKPWTRNFPGHNCLRLRVLSSACHLSLAPSQYRPDLTAMATMRPDTFTRCHRSTGVVSNRTAVGRRPFLLSVAVPRASRARSHVRVRSSPDADIHIRPAELIDYWPAADLHCRAFSPAAENHDEWEVRVGAWWAWWMGVVVVGQRDCGRGPGKGRSPYQSLLHQPQTRALYTAAGCADGLT